MFGRRFRLALCAGLFATILPSYANKVPLRCVIVGQDAGGESVSPIDEAAVSNQFQEINRIFRQAAVEFEIASCIRTNSTELSDINETNSVQQTALFSILPQGNGLEIYYVKSIIGGSAAFCTPRGIVIGGGVTARTVARELGHACGLSDIYGTVILSNCTITVEGPLARDKAPDDWGHYDGVSDQRDLVERLLMFGAASATGTDISYGDVLGVWYSALNMEEAIENTNCWHTSLAPVGFHYHGNRHPRSEDWDED